MHEMVLFFLSSDLIDSESSISGATPYLPPIITSINIAFSIVAIDFTFVTSGNSALDASEKSDNAVEMLVIK